MIALVQRVTEAHVTVAGEVVGAIGPGWLVLLGVGGGDGPDDASYLAEKTLNLRAFHDPDGQMNRSVLETGGSLLVVSQFTLYGDCRKGRRPGFSEAAPPELAQALYLSYGERLRVSGATVATGRFQTEMAVSLVNDGPVTLLLDSRKGF